MEARTRELELRSKVSVIVATDLSSTLEEGAGAGESIEQAIRDAKARIETVRSVANGLEIVTTLVSLAAAIATGEVDRILMSISSMAELA